MPDELERGSLSVFVAIKARFLLYHVPNAFNDLQPISRRNANL